VAKGGGRGLLYFTLFAPGQVSLSLRSHRSNNLIVVVELCAGSAEFADDFGEVVRERRHKLGVSQEEFADICGLDWTDVGGSNAESVTSRASKSRNSGAGFSLTRTRFSEGQRFSDGFLVSSSLRSPSSDIARQESHQLASPASRLRGRLHSDRCRTTRSPLARGLLPGGAWPRGRQRAAALSFPYSALRTMRGSLQSTGSSLRWQQDFSSLRAKRTHSRILGAALGVPWDCCAKGLRCPLFHSPDVIEGEDRVRR